MRRWLLGAVGLLGVVLVGLVVAASRAQDEARAHLEMHSLTEAEVDEIIRGHQYLATLEAFQRPGDQRDAGALLNPMVSLGQVHGPGAQNAWWMQLDDQELDALFGNWRTEPGSVPAGDLSLLTQLLDYDHWDRGTAAVVSDYLENPAYLSQREVGSPALAELHILALLRLSQGLRESDMLPALREVRHLARLTHDGGSGSIETTFMLFRLEAKAHEYALEQGLLDVGAWEPVAEADIELARKTLEGTRLISLGLAPLGSMTRLEDSGVPLFGICEVVASTSEILLYFRQSLKGHWPGEVPLLSHWEANGARISHPRCSLPVTQLYWEQPRLGSASTLLDVGLEERVPYLRMGRVIRHYAFLNSATAWRVAF